MAHRLSREELIRALEHRFVIPQQLRHAGGNARSGYVRRMEAENKLQFSKVSRPSKYLIDKYGSNNEHYDDGPTDNGYDDSPLFAHGDVVEYNVGKLKPKKVAAKKRGPTEVELEREEARVQEAQHAERVRKQKQLDDLEMLRKLAVECHKMLQKEDNTYHDVIKELQHRRGMKKVAKSDLQEQIIVKHNANIKKIKQQYAMVYTYAKSHKLNANDLNSVQKHIRIQITKSQ